MFNHVMVIGGTGMLAEATAYLCLHASAVTSFSRAPATLHGQSDRLIPIRADYSCVYEFNRTVSEVIDQYGPPSLVLAWFHDDEPALRFAKQLATLDSPFAFFHVLGSASANPGMSIEEQRRPFEGLAGITYHQVVLGFQYQDAKSRWLTHREIATGVIEAIQVRQPLRIVGHVTPWADRP
ncbi:short-chain dehydrogenase [Chitinimonas prasina]|uniref:Short-chain dehydrogenase n=1 Tax=Chitinimonas prasina TaxID=1434937 RepID=A0ABQ5YJ76_9NEIS|nr:hypothetical protein [Chitinimonas prasina]GLR14679.1 short-chain dehydrogenase [Chitinimonas prasina]